MRRMGNQIFLLLARDAWEQDMKCRALARTARYGDSAAMVMNHFIDHRQTHPATSEFCRVEGIENSGLCVVGYSVSRIRDLQPDGLRSAALPLHIRRGHRYRSILRSDRFGC